MNKTFVNFVVVVFLSLILSGCGAVIHSNVSVFHNLPKNDSQPKVEYSFLKLEGQENSLEYDTYQLKIKNHLINNNFIENENSNLLISIQYGINNGKEKMGSTPIFGQTGVSSSYTSGTVTSYGGGYGSYSGATTYTPTYGVVGSSSHSYTEYTRYLNMYMYDKSSKKVVYEGKVVSSGSTGQLLPVIDEMMEALFKNFPGESGKSYSIEVSSVE